MTVMTEGRHTGEFILSEEQGNYARDNATLLEGQNLEAGTVVSKDGDDKYSMFTVGGDAVAGILYANVDATDADTPCVVMVRGPLEVIADALVWESGISDQDKATAVAALAALGIIVR
jgi:hypothetical protein